MNDVSRETLLGTVSVLIEEMMRDWDALLTEPISESTALVADLGYESVDLMQLMVALEQAFEVRGLPYEELFLEDGAYVSELQVDRLLDFLQRTLPAPR